MDRRCRETSAISDPHSALAISTPSLAIIVATLNERDALPETMAALRALDGNFEILFVDGGSSDGTREWLASRSLQVVVEEQGRGAQFAAGASRARAPILWFLHADCRPEPQALQMILDAVKQGTVAGVCSLRFEGSGRPARFMTWLYPKLSALGLFYGDAGLFVRADVYGALGGVRKWPLFEDLDFITRLRRSHPGSFRRISARIEASSRRFHGPRFPAVFARWVLLQCLYWLGVSPQLLAQLYRPVR